MDQQVACGWAHQQLVRKGHERAVEPALARVLQHEAGCVGVATEAREGDQDLDLVRSKSVQRESKPRRGSGSGDARHPGW